MCGIMGYVGDREASFILFQGLKRLEYRGYDSAGIAIRADDGRIDIRRCIGKLDQLEKLLREAPLHGPIGIGHTRWATHGGVTDANAHPHRAGHVVLIHNGIIENYLLLRAAMIAKGRTISSQTDTEIISHLIDDWMQQGLDFVAATRRAIEQLEGSFAIVVMCDLEPDKLLAAKSATPIVIGLGNGENLIASDIPALLDHTRDVLFLEDGELAEVTRDHVKLSTFAGTPVTRAPRRVLWDPVTAQKGGYKHFLAKEIHEQPQAIIDTTRGRLELEAGDVALPEIDLGPEWWQRIDRITLVACGTAWHSCLIAKFYIEQLARIPCDVDYGSEFRYRDPVVDGRTLVIAVSQSGETLDTLAALATGRERGAQTLAICNVVDSSIARRAAAVLYTHAGPEISVASTKAFTTQVTALFLLALHLARRRGTVTAENGRELLQHLVTVPHHIETVLQQDAAIEQLARRYEHARDVLFLGRGINYPIALEGALKLKELSYIHAEGYPAGEMKHGPIALINEEVPVLLLLPHDRVYAKTVSNMKEVESRGGRIIAVTDAVDDELEAVAADILRVPTLHPLLMPVVLTIPLQLFAYHVAVRRGTDVDQPRNLAKSVTVE
ncbi:MAG: glutamine--fructose-6-phosphate transaminase (isomerizing) [Deltaproteobacteria bacterium]|nr:glutamine--fructose-6-phosphate transaminase (isomerizing) [Deltaproteobacteria bacterium]MBI3387478.1 glutamine--fructose-6-phosphate transaminase (isomerizing) [Deltaproteobacteria bacterium]